MVETISQYSVYLENAQWLSYPVSLLLGFLAGIGAITCFLPIVPAIIGFIGGQEITRRRLFLIPFIVMLGSVLILSIFGVTVSLAGLTFQKYLGPYWHYLVGVVCIVIGIILLGIVKLPTVALPQMKTRGIWSALVFGILMGGVIGFGSSCCVPTLPIVLTYAGIQGRPIHGALILGTFAIGQSVPLFAIGLFSGALGNITSRWSSLIRKIMAVMLLILGIYFIVWGAQ